MKSILTAILLIAVMIVAPVYAMQDQQGDQKRGRTSGETQTIEGVIDQTGGKYVIATEKQIKPMATLQAVGFKESNFARFIGLKVRIKGQLTGEGDEKTFRVQSLSDIEKIGPTTTK